MDEPTPKKPESKDAEIAAADWLLEDSTPTESARPGAHVILPTGDEGFDLAGPPSDSGDAPPAVEPPRAIPVRERTRAALPPTPAVEQVWSRGAEWGASLLRLGAWAALVLWLLYVGIGAEAYSLAAILFAVGGLGALILSYPILITLERPVRMTPEQAARDYYGSLSHHFPPYRRMWLLLSARGRKSSEFSTFDEFRRYWAGRLAQLREGHAGGFTPLAFQVDDFRAEKSAGRTEIDGRFKLRVLVRGRRDKGPIWSFPLDRNFSRGPDGMWYLDDGTLSQQGETPGAKG